MFLINWGEIKGRIDPSSFRKFAVFHSDRFPIQPMGEVIEINPRISFLDLDKDADISFVPMERIDEAFGSIKDTITKKIRDSIDFAVIRKYSQQFITNADRQGASRELITFTSGRLSAFLSAYGLLRAYGKLQELFQIAQAEKADSYHKRATGDFPRYT